MIDTTMTPGVPPAAEQRPRWSPARLAYAFYGVAAAGAVAGQVWVALDRIGWSPAMPLWARIALVAPFALCLELLAMALAAMGDERMRLGERAYGYRIFSAVVAVLAVGILVIGHWPHLYLTAAFGALSSSAYLLWLLHSAARRRDALRQAGKLDQTAPAYGWWRRLRHPILTARAAELAREQGLDLHASLRAAELALRAEARRPALAAAVERAVRADHHDPLLAEVEARTLDLDAIAVELERRADYRWWATRLSPARTTTADAGADMSAPGSGLMSAPTPAARPRRKSSRTRGGQAGTVADRITDLLAQHPDMTRVELAKHAGTSTRHVRRVLADMSVRTAGPNAATSGADPADLAGDIAADVPPDTATRTNGHRPD